MPNTREKLIELLHLAHTKVADLVLEDDEKTYSDAIEMEADHLIANGVTVQEWISVKDRFPEEDGDYLTCCNYGEWSQISILGFAKDGDNIWGGGFNGEKNVFYYDYDGVNVSQDDITHWMPLPHWIAEGCNPVCIDLMHKSEELKAIKEDRDYWRGIADKALQAVVDIAKGECK